jgi:hypothetical protein
MAKERNTVEAAQQRVHDATEAVIQAGDTVIEANLWEAAEAALDGRPKKYIADIISGKKEGPYKPTSGWAAR